MWSAPKIAIRSGSMSRIRFRFWNTASAVPRYQDSPHRICGGTGMMKCSSTTALIRHPRRMWSISDWDLYWTRMYSEKIRELMKLLSTKSTIRYLLPNGTAGLLRSFVSGYRRSPLPPARMTPRMRGRVTNVARARSRLRRREPRGRLDVLGDARKAEVLGLLADQQFVFLPRQRSAAVHALRELEQPREVGVVFGEPRLRVVPSRPGRDQELPVRGLQQEHLPAELGDDSPQQRGPLPGRVRHKFPQFLLGLVDHLPRPCGILVQPDAVVSSFPPRPFEQRDRAAGPMLGMICAGRGRRHALGREAAEHVIEPGGTLVPPVSEQLGVERTAEDAGLPCLVRMAREHAADECREVGRVRARPFPGPLRHVDLLVGEVALRMRDPPEPEPAGKVALVKLEVPLVARIPRVPAPDLERRLRVTHERHGVPGPPPRSHPVGQVGTPVLPAVKLSLRPRHGAQPGEIVAVRRQRLSAAYEVDVGEKVREAVPGQQLLDAAAPVPDLSAARPDRRGPLVPRTIRALGKPHSRRRAAEVSAVRLDGRAELQVQALVPAEQREVAMRRGRCDELDRAPVREAAEACEQISAHLLKLTPPRFVDRAPMAAEGREGVLVRVGEVAAGFLTAPQALV